MALSFTSFRRLLAPLALVAFVAGAHAREAGAAPPATPVAPGALLDGAAWQRHASRDLLPYWREAGALGVPPGRFPTFRCDDGRAFEPARPCNELTHGPAWIRPELGRQYVRMQARQTFAYAVGFHLTGDPALLSLAAAGARDIRERALDAATGSAATFHDADGRPQPPVGQRTTQDLAYAGLGLAAYWHLTRDPATLEALDRLHRHVMSHFDAERGEMRWMLEGLEADRRELVAQLDLLNAYMVLVTPQLTGERRARWRADMARLVGAIRTHYCAGAAPRCLGTIAPGSEAPGARHNDYGHSGKAFWMVLLAARQLGDVDSAEWAATRARALLAEAFDPVHGTWASRWTASGPEQGRSWWIHAELDQLAATLALDEAGPRAWLARSGPYWLRHFVDRERGEVHGGLAPDGTPHGGPTQHHWKNGYHSMEHALLGYLTAQALAGEPATLYYAIDRRAASGLAPYLHAGQVLAHEALGTPSAPLLKVRFSVGGAGPR